METLLTSVEKMEHLREEVKNLSNSEKMKNWREQFDQIKQFEEEMSELSEKEYLMEVKLSIDVDHEIEPILHDFGASLLTVGMASFKAYILCIALVAMGFGQASASPDVVRAVEPHPEVRCNPNLTPNPGSNRKPRTLADSFGEAILKFLG